MDHLSARLFGSEQALLFKLTPAHLEALQYVERPTEGRAGGARHRGRRRAAGGAAADEVEG